MEFEKINLRGEKLFLREVYKFLKDEFGVIKLVTTTVVKEKWRNKTYYR